MRIYCAVKHSADPRQFYGSLWSGNFYPALSELGHEVVESPVDLLPTSRNMANTAAELDTQALELRARTTQAVIDDLKAQHARQPIGLFLSYFYVSHFDPAGFDEIEKLGIPAINYYCNSVHQFPLVADIARRVRWSWYAEKPAGPSYRAVGARPVWVQMGADPSVYHPVDGLTRAADAVFVGQNYADRDRWMAALIRAGVLVEIYGPSWGVPAGAPAAVINSDGVNSRPVGHDRSAVARILKQHGPIRGPLRVWSKWNARRISRSIAPLFPPFAKGAVPFTEIARLFSSHEIVLNFSNVWGDGEPGSGLIPHVRLRDFEGPMCRTCFLTGYTDEITEFYEVGKEIDTYRSTGELVDKARHYLKNPDAAERLRDAGYRRALRDHTWVQRFRQLFRLTGLVP